MNPVSISSTTRSRPSYTSSMSRAHVSYPYIDPVAIQDPHHDFHRDRSQPQSQHTRDESPDASRDQSHSSIESQSQSNSQSYREQGGQVPTIRLVSGTPFAIGAASPFSDSNTSLRLPLPVPTIVPMPNRDSVALADMSMATGMSSYVAVSPPSPPNHVVDTLAPKDQDGERRRVVPKKKSKLSLLVGGSMRGSKENKEAKENGGLGTTRGRSKLSIGPGGSGNKDLSDVTRRIGAGTSTIGRGRGKSGKAGFEIYVDQENEAVEEVVVMKKKKSRIGLDGIRWGSGNSNANASASGAGSGGRTTSETGMLGEVTNAQQREREMGSKGSARLLKPKLDEKDSKWWSIGRGRKDAKENKDKEKDKEAKKRSKTPDLFKSSRTRFNSLDSGILLNSPTETSAPTNSNADAAPESQRPRTVLQGLRSASQTLLVPVSHHTNLDADATSPVEDRFARPQSPAMLAPLSTGPAPVSSPTRLAPSPTSPRRVSSPAATLLAPPTNPSTGSIAVRAMRSMRSMARLGSWAPSSNTNNLSREEEEAASPISPAIITASAIANYTAMGNMSATNLANTTTANANGTPITTATSGAKKKEKPKDAHLTISKKKKRTKTRESLATANANATRYSGSSFEAGAPSPMSECFYQKPQQMLLHPHNGQSQGPVKGGEQQEQPQATLQPKMLDSTKRKASMLGIGLPSSFKFGTARAFSGTTASRLSASSASTASAEERRCPPVSGMGRGRSGSAVSAASSLRPISTSSGMSGASSSSSVGSVRWDEYKLVTVKEQKKQERAEAEKAAELEKGKEREAERRHTRKPGDARKRMALMDIFPEQMVTSSPKERRPISESSASFSCMPIPEPPLVMVQEPTLEMSEGTEGTEDEDVVVFRGEDFGVEPQSENRPQRETPSRRIRRHMSEQLSDKDQQGAVMDDVEGVLELLDQATSDLASLIGRLDLEATPGAGSPNGSPFRLSPSLTRALRNTPSLRFGAGGSVRAGAYGSPLKKVTAIGATPSKQPNTRTSMSSITSLRPYAQSRARGKSTISGSIPEKTATLVGRQIVPWPISPTKSSPQRRATAPAPTVGGAPTFRFPYRPTFSPAPMADPPLVFHPLRPSKVKAPAMTARPASSVVGSVSSTPSIPTGSPSSVTFGSAPPPNAEGSSLAEEKDDEPSPIPVFRSRAQEKPNSPPMMLTLNTEDSNVSLRPVRGVPISPAARKGLGLTGTMGDAEEDGEQELSDDPDSDIPEELQAILHSGQAGETETERYEDTLTFDGHLGLRLPPSPGSPPESPLPMPDSSAPSVVIPEVPVFRASLTMEDEEEGVQLDDSDFSNSNPNSPNQDHTGKSFDFTGELKVLNESGANNRHSFVEQLENAFKTPAKFDLERIGQSSGNEDADANQRMPDISLAMRSLGLQDSLPRSVSNGSMDVSDIGQPPIGLLPSPDIVDPRTRSSRGSATSGLGIDDSMTFSFDIGQSPIGLLPSPDIIVPKARGSRASTTSFSSRKSRSSSRSKASDGQLDVNFKFGGKGSMSPRRAHTRTPSILTLSDIIPSPSHARSLSMASFSSDMPKVEEDSYALKSIFEKATDGAAEASPVPSLPRRRADSDAEPDSASKRAAREQALIDLVVGPQGSHSRAPSDMSFNGFEMFGDVRRGFEFGGERPSFYPPPSASAPRGHMPRDSVFSMASISSYGAVLNSGTPDPFDYGVPALSDRPSSDDMSMSFSMSIDDTFSFIRQNPTQPLRRRRLDSDDSTFSFRASQILRPSIVPRNHHHRQESNMSNTSFAPPISLYNRSFGAHGPGHRRNDSNNTNNSASSIAHAYANLQHLYGSARSKIARHRQEQSMESSRSDMEALRNGMGRTMGDKMLDSAFEYCMPLPSISDSPRESEDEDVMMDNRSMEDSILDRESGRVFSLSDSIFEKTNRPISVSSEEVFNDSEPSRRRDLFSVGQFRPISIYSDDMSSDSDERPQDDDTMITMFDGSLVRRRSVGSVLETSPCIRVGKRKAIRGPQHRVVGSEDDVRESPNKVFLREQPSINTIAGDRFGDERMTHVQQGLNARQSLEENCLSAEGEDGGSLRPPPVFTRPGRSRSSTVTSSSGGDTPPLSACEHSSQSSESQSSIDIAQLNAILTGMTLPLTGIARERMRARARGAGHRRRASQIAQARMSRSSVYETIEEEMSVNNTPGPSKTVSPDKTALSPVRDDVMIVDADDTRSVRSWNEDKDMVELKKYYALKNEAHDTVEESRRTWMDTPFSIYAVQCFEPPGQPAGMKALLEHSKQTYGPLPSDLRPRRVRSRTNSRPSPYPRSQFATSPGMKSSPFEQHSSPVMPEYVNRNSVVHEMTLQERTSNPNLTNATLADISPFIPMKNSFDVPIRPRVASVARRNALGWSKRNTAGKENRESRENVSNGTIVSANGDSLRLNRPRPRGRPYSVRA